MTNRTTTLALLLAMAATAVSAQNATEDCPVSWGWYPNKENCIKYYQCQNYRRVDFICDKDPDFPDQHMLYDIELTGCNHVNMVDCGERPICDEFDANCGQQTTSTTTPKTTYPPVDFVCPEDYGHFADPDNCIYYIYCDAGVPERLLCPTAPTGEQEHYNAEKNWCDYPANVDCGERPICDMFDQNCSDPTATTTEDPDAFKCPTPNDYFPDPENCIKYYHCVNNKATRVTCPIGNGIQEYWDATMDWCDFPERVNCGSRPVCDLEDKNCVTVTPPPSTTPRPPTPCDDIKCDDGDGWHLIGPCENCMCECANGYPFHLCCSEGLVFDIETEACVNPEDIEGCTKRY